MTSRRRMQDSPASVIVVSGIPGVGKSTIAARLARHFRRGVHLEADVLQRMIVSGGLWPDQEPFPESRRQLRLRCWNTALLADSFREAGFTTIVDDVIVGARFEEFRADLGSRPFYFVLLLAELDVLRQRNAARPDKDVFQTWRHLDEVARRETPRRGLWLDTSRLGVEETVAEILRRLPSEGAVE